MACESHGILQPLLHCSGHEAAAPCLFNFEVLSPRGTIKHRTYYEMRDEVETHRERAQGMFAAGNKSRSRNLRHPPNPAPPHIRKLLESAARGNQPRFHTEGGQKGTRVDRVSRVTVGWRGRQAPQPHGAWQASPKCGLHRPVVTGPGNQHFEQAPPCPRTWRKRPTEGGVERAQATAVNGHWRRPGSAPRLHSSGQRPPCLEPWPPRL